MSRTPGSQQQLEEHIESRLSFSTPASPSAAREARRAVADSPNGLSTHLGRDGLLLLTELINNAVIHGSRSAMDNVSVDIRTWGDRLRVEVRDDGAGFAWRRPPEEPGRVTGYGLVLVEEVAESWGIDTASDRTCVWFEL
jgi:anti-sigma regulatory factor (Ser/Thr protein kinase)